MVLCDILRGFYTKCSVSTLNELRKDPPILSWLNHLFLWSFPIAILIENRWYIGKWGCIGDSRCAEGADAMPSPVGGK